jgi:hypothetical protein
MLYFSIRDNAAQTFENPFLRPTKASALRAVRDAMNEPGPWGKHPEDYALYCLGEFCDTTGIITAHPPEHIEALINIQSGSEVPNDLPRIHAEGKE